MRFYEETYKTPPGYADYPFAYVFDASELTDGTDYQDLQLPLQGDSDFILRHIAGVPLCINTGAAGGRFTYKNASRSYASSAPYGMVFPNNFPVVPEKLYPRNGSIYLDLYDTLRAVNACEANNIYSSQIAFFGVKRYPVNEGYLIQRTPYKYREKTYRYEFPLTVNWGHFVSDAANAGTEPARRFQVILDNFDFELCQILISAEDAEGALITQDFQIQLYSPTMHQLSSLPLNQGFINSARTSPSVQAPYQGLYPVPSMVWPAGGNIVFDITSLLCVADQPISYNISFLGMWRIPCD